MISISPADESRQKITLCYGSRMNTSEHTGVSQVIKKGAGWIVALGVATILLGIFALSAPLFIGMAVQYLVGAALMIGGIFQIMHAVKSGGAFTIVSGLLAVICGGIMFAKPLMGLGVITLFLIAYFVSDGLIKIIYALKHRPNQGWGWFLFSGLITFLLGLALWKEWPLSGAWAIGTLFGINLIFNGWSMIATGSTVRQAIKANEPVDI